MHPSSFLLTLTVATSVSLNPAISEADQPGYPAGVAEVHYRSSADQSLQPALYWAPPNDDAVPLLVALHTWSSSYQSREPQYPQWCQRAGWAFIYPNFRGPNKTAEALGSDLVVADIVSAVAYAQSQTKIDPDRIYCVGVSGGGHAAQLLAARAPELWAGVSAWCGISDIAAWHQQCAGTNHAKYARDIELALGRHPTGSAEWLDDAKVRSPLTWLAKAERLPPLDLNHGVDDGRTGSVPFTHSIKAWNAAVDKPWRITADDAKHFYAQRQVPAELQATNQAGADPLYRRNQPIYVRSRGNVRLTIFQGGHEIVHHAALNWLANQTRNKPANWRPEQVIDFAGTDADQQSGK